MKKEKAMELMNDFPETPEELKRQARQLLSKYLIVDKSGNAYCTGCEFETAIEEIPAHRATTTCPSCGATVTCIRNHHNFCGSVVESERNVAIFIPGDNGNLYVSCCVFRLFFSAHQLMPTISIFESQRYIFTDKNAVRYGRDFYWEQSGGYYRKQYRSCWTPRTKFTEPIFNNFKRYDVINEEAVKNTCMKHCAINLYSGDFLFEYLKFYRKYPGAERLLKCGLGKYVEGAVENRYTTYLDKIHWKETEVHKMLGVNRDVLRAIRQNRISLDSYRTAAEHFPDATLESLIAYNNIIGWSYGTLERLSVEVAEREEKILKYLIKQKVGRLDDYGDYIRLCMELGYDLSDPCVAFPPCLMTAHDRLHDIRDTLKREREINEQKAMQSEFSKNFKKRIKFEYASDEYIIRQPKSIMEIVDEGKALSHCVGGYAERHATGKLSIMFLRKKSEPDKPFYTVEVSTDGHIIQCRGYKNNWEGRGGTPKPQEIIDFENEYQEYLNSVFRRKKARKSA